MVVETCDTDQHENAEKSEMACNYHDIQPYLEYIDNMLAKYFVTHGPSFQFMFQQGFANTFGTSAYCRKITVEQAVRVVLNYYREVLLQYSLFCCSNKNGCKTNEASENEIIALMNNFETRVKKKDWRVLLQAKQYLYPQEQSQHTTYHCNIIHNAQNKVDVLMCRLLNIENCAFKDSSQDSSCNETGVQESNQYNSMSSSTHNCQDINTSHHWCNTTDNVICQCNDEYVDRAFLEEMKYDGDAICNGQYNDDKTEDALNVIFDDELEMRMLDMFYGNRRKPMESEYITSQYPDKISESMDVEFCDFDLRYNTVLYEDIVKRKCHNMRKHLSQIENSMLKKIVLYYNDLVQMHHVTISQAVAQVDKVLTYFAKRISKQMSN